MATYEELVGISEAESQLIRSLGIGSGAIPASSYEKRDWPRIERAVDAMMRKTEQSLALPDKKQASPPRKSEPFAITNQTAQTIIGGNVVYSQPQNFRNVVESKPRSRAGPVTIYSKQDLQSMSIAKLEQIAVDESVDEDSQREARVIVETKHAMVHTKAPGVHKFSAEQFSKVQA